MDKNKIISNANISVTNILLDFPNQSSNLRILKCLKEINDNLPYFKSSANKTRLLSKVKSSMFVVDSETKKRLTTIASATDQLEICFNCMCKTCALNDENCNCNGCLYGGYVSRCDGGTGIETRSVVSNTITFNKSDVVLLEHNRATKKNIITIINDLNLTTKYYYNFVDGTYTLIG
jgi:hypothetical protein